MRFACIVTLALGLPIQPSRGQDSTALKSIATVQIDNDLLALRGRGHPSDFDYTHGARLSYIVPQGPSVAAQILNAARGCTLAGPTNFSCLVSTFSLGQAIFTPRHDTVPPTPGDRPHAAWLYGAFEVSAVGKRNLKAFELEVGVTGRPALGEQVQNSVHRLLHNKAEVGWDQQIPSHLGALAQAEATKFINRLPCQAQCSLAVTGGLTVGTVRIAGRGRVSMNYDFFPFYARRLDAPELDHPGRLSLALSAQQYRVFRDVFIQGVNTGPGATLLPWVGEIAAKVKWRFSQITSEYGYVSRSREYVGQPRHDAYGTVSLWVTR